MQVFRYAIAVIATASMYCLICRLNAYLFEQLNHSFGVMWIYLPSGLRMMAVLVLGGWGAIGIGLGTFVLTFFTDPAVDIVTATGKSLVSGAAPLIGLWICQSKFKLDVAMANLSASLLLKMAVIFAIVSPVLHQAWYFLRGQTQNIYSSLLVMTIGDFVGTLILFYAVKLFLQQLPQGMLSK